MDTMPPYLRIAAAISDRIADGELAAGQRVPSARQIMRDWGVAMATATKVLAALRQEGLVEARTGVGTVVRASGARPPTARRSAEGTLTRDRLVATGIAIADTDGLDALSMRRLATELGAGVMSLYRHVSGKDELVTLMLRSVFAASELPARGPEGWRAKLELVCQAQWTLYQHHPWTAAAVSMTRPLLLPEAMAHTEWTLAALDGVGLGDEERLREAVSLPAFVRGLALSVAAEREAERRTGLTNDQWWVSSVREVESVLATGRFPLLAATSAGVATDLDAVFRQGLARHLDGLAARVAGRESP
ncbi:TetR/AcrR family transcriptional regulator C-terminal domain-containing protein [Prauserella cavernicola]|uniref:TetR/AcrR family transcriptional regulator C-terminal domain-containing protein n=1 Tax=Prauserella cavernicola TaxID=2800127 RepID=A0A934V1K5_9PSEU|nr:TetR/AcrR family transcriptional regulator C-terminal domain-containing protein [Prauserella cavernicola]MBK1783341.1 TetR/AcrR family transcriptional regulator C-terminal domain-containing protein [Prauserella cavernicola]